MYGHKINNVLYIDKPKIASSKFGYKIEAEYRVNEKNETLWYEVKEKYQEYLTHERVDGFLVGLLFYALKNNYNIEVLGPVSAELIYKLNKYLIPLLSQVYNYKEIKISSEFMVSEKLSSKNAVGTGLSCGIDSFSTIYENMVKEEEEGYKITHFTFLNVGSHGDYGGVDSTALFLERAAIAKNCADELGKELILVNSNISEILQMNFQSTNSLRSLSAILILQKLFKVYYYSSSYHIKNFKLSNKDTSYFDVFNMTMLSTENLKFFSSCPTYSRVEKTRMVAEYTPSYKYLNVCVKDGNNCGKCFKCMRTLLTLEIFNEVQNFSSIFNMEAYNHAKKKYIARVIGNKDYDVFDREIYDEMLKVNYNIPLYSKFAAFYYKSKSIIKSKILGKLSGRKLILFKNQFYTIVYKGNDNNV
jgi:bacterioferritin-associated ferredoxin